MLKTLHLTTVIITISLFLLRGVGMWWQAGFMRQRWVKIAPHVNDTILLVTGILLAMRIQQYPLLHGWLTVKLLALLAYIALGMLAFRFARNDRQRLLAWSGAILVFIYMFSVGWYRHPLGFIWAAWLA